MAVLCVLLVISCFYDYRESRIPNLLLLGLLLAGAAENLLENGGMGSGIFLLKAAAVTALLYPFFKIGTVGAGDVKLMGICAGYFPGDRILHFLFFSMLVAAIFSLIKLWRYKNMCERLCYLGEYLTDVMQTGNWHLYLKDQRQRKVAGLCLSGPILIGALLHWGGVY